MAREPVKINIYDMTSLNAYMSAVGIGIYHCGIQIYNTEFGYGGHPFSFSGVFEIEPKNELALGEENFKYRETIVLGYTDFNNDEVREIINNLDTLAKELCGKGIPSWVNRLAYACTCVPFLEKFLPQELLTPIVIEENLSKNINLNSELIENVKNEQNSIKLFKKKP